MNWDHLGGMMDLESKPNAIDSRLDSFDHYGVLPDYLAIMHGQNSLELMDKYRIDHVLVQASMPLSYLLLRTPGWRLEMREKAWDGDDFVLYAKVPVAASGSVVCPPAAPAAQH